MPIKGNRPPCKSASATSINLIGNIGALTITALLFYLGAQPFAAGLIPTPWDKIAHFIVFATISALLWLGCAGRKPLLVLATVCLIGALDEWRQGHLPERSMDLADLAVDISAASFTLIVLHAMHRNRAVT